MWFIASKDVLYTLRERTSLLWLFVMPVVFFFFIGTITGGSKMPGAAGRRVTLALQVPADGGFLLEQLERRLEENGFDLVRYDERGARLDAAEAEKAAGRFEDQSRRLVVPAGFTDHVLNGEAVDLRLRSDSDLSGDLDQLKVKRAAYTVLADVIATSEDAAETGAAPSLETLAKLNAMQRTLTLAVEPAGNRAEIPTGFAQAVPGTMVMFTVLVLLTSGAMLLLIERQQGLLRRLAATPIPRGRIVLGKWGGKVILGLIQIAFAMIVGTLFFGMDWGPSLPMIGLVLFAWAAFCASAGLLLGSVARTEGQVVGLGVLTSMILGALGGCWWPIEITPAWMQALQKCLPSGWAMDALHRLVSFGAGPGSAIPHVTALLIAALVTGWLAQRRFRFA